MTMQHHEPERPSTPRTITPLSTPAVGSVGMLRFPYAQAELHALVKSALDEDGAFNDLTTIATVVSDRRAAARRRRCVAVNVCAEFISWPVAETT